MATLRKKGVPITDLGPICRILVVLTWGGGAVVRDFERPVKAMVLLFPQMHPHNWFCTSHLQML